MDSPDDISCGSVSDGSSIVETLSRIALPNNQVGRVFIWWFIHGQTNNQVGRVFMWFIHGQPGRYLMWSDGSSIVEPLSIAGSNVLQVCLLLTFCACLVQIHLRRKCRFTQSDSVLEGFETDIVSVNIYIHFAFQNTHSETQVPICLPSRDI